MSNLALPESISDAWDIVTSESRSELMLTASYKPKSNSIAIRFGNFKKLRIPMSWIRENYPDSDPDPTNLSIVGMGQILFVGDQCEIDVTHILRDF